jgi:hypothetical protein
MLHILSRKGGLARLLRHKLVILAGLIAGSFLLSVYSVSAREPAPGWVPNGTKYSCNTCHVPGNITADTQMLLDFWHTTPTIKTWTVALAQTDSDGDGWTNGEELQDPAGAWSVGNPSPGTFARVSNPSDLGSQPPTPQINFSGLSAGGSISGQVAIGTQVVAGYPTDLTKVVYELANFDGEVVYTYTDSSAPFCFAPGCAAWDSSSVPSGAHTIRQIASDKRSAAAGGPRTISYSAGIYIDNPEPPSVEFKQGNYTIGEGDSTATVVVELSEPWGQTITVAYATDDGTAKEPGDYGAASDTLTFDPGTTSAAFQVSIANDTLDESNETIKLALSDPSNALLGDRAEATITIVDNDAPPELPNISISADDSVAAEAGLNGGIFTVVRSGSIGAPLTIDYTVEGTATADDDYAELDGSITIPAGASSATIALAPIDDDDSEGIETVIVALNTKAAYKLKAPTSATITIADDDTTEQLVDILIEDAHAAEAGIEAGRLTIVRSGSTDMPLVVGYTIGGTATNGVDYIPLAGSVSIPTGASSVTIEVMPQDDTSVEGAEIVVLTLIPSAGYTIGAPASATIAIADDDQSQPAPGHRLYLPLVMRAD